MKCQGLFSLKNKEKENKTIKKFNGTAAVTVVRLALLGLKLTLFMLNKLRCHPPLLICSQSDYLIQVVDINSHTECLQKPTDRGSTLFAKSKVYLGSAGQGLRI